MRRTLGEAARRSTAAGCGRTMFMAARADRALESLADRQARQRAFNEQLDRLGGEPLLFTANAA